MNQQSTHINKISVILPVFNGIKYLEKSVYSVINQDFNDFEFLICDDFSNDGSYEYLKSLNSSKIKLFRNSENIGLFPTLNILIKKCNSPLIHLWAQDDIMLPNCLEETVKFHEKFQNINFSFSRLQSIDEKDNLVRKPDTFAHKTISAEGHAISSILYGSIAGNISNVCIVKKAVENIGYFNEKMKYVGDFEMWCKLSKNTAIGMNGKILVHVRQHSGQYSRNIEASYYKLQETINVYACFLDTIKPELRKKAKRALKWKIYPSYFTQFLFILKNKKLSLAFKYLRFINKYNFIPFLVFKWFIISFLDLIDKKEKFYLNYLIKPIERTRKNI
ncbi:MAG: glycosyltransferase [Bacteroidales bacterium]|nr:glycosyltransferase [Bacteroidales bacterium]MBN2757661.1 glycosyltransferase [Bacteroidales bacterium]